MSDRFLDKFKMHGAMSATLVKADGSVELTHKDNIIVNVGFDLIADAIGRASGRPAVLSHIGVGAGTAAPLPADTTLVSQIGRLAATYAHTAGTKTFTFTSVFNPGVATGAITEAGVFNAATNGTMLDRVTFPVVNKGADDTLTVVFTFTMS